MIRMPRTPSESGTQSGVAVLPIIIGIAVAIALLQVPMLYKTRSGNTFSGNQKGNISAKSLAEAGIDAVISDIGRKAISVTLETDTTPYSGVHLGRGTYTTHIKAYQTNPDRIEVVSTGTIGSATQSVRAKMEVVKTLSTIPYDTPKISLWGIRGTPPVLYYHSLDERDSGHAWIHPEGKVVLPGVPFSNVDDFTVAPNGHMYFINNFPGTNSTLYEILPIDLDNNPATDVVARLVGPTGLVAGTADEIRGLTFTARDTSGKNGVLFAVTWQSKKVYELNLETGLASFVADIVPDGLAAGTAFWCDAMTQDLAGTVYIVRNNTKSELWRFDEFGSTAGITTNPVSLVATISGVKDKTRSIAGHPNGYIYATDDEKWYRISPYSMPVNARTQTLYTDSSGLKGMGFLFEREDLKFTGTPAKHKIKVCHQPPAMAGVCPARYTISIDTVALQPHLTHGNGCPVDTYGYCGWTGVGTTMVADTTIQLKIISWEEFTGNQVGSL